jgi:hypothetical protein
MLEIFRLRSIMFELLCSMKKKIRFLVTYLSIYKKSCTASVF